MAQELILIRGLPGSGKSTLAKMILEAQGGEMGGWYHYEADMYFETPDGYNFSPVGIPSAHEWCQEITREQLEFGHCVIVSNTFSRIWEMRPYIDMVDKLDIRLTVITCEGNFGSVHNVPKETIEKMSKRWEKYDG